MEGYITGIKKSILTRYKKILGEFTMKKKMFELFRSEENFIKSITEDMDVNEKKYPLDYYKTHHNFIDRNRKNHIMSDEDNHVISVTAFSDIIIGDVCYFNGNKYDYKVVVIYDRKTKEYKNYLEFHREYKNLGNGYYEKMDWNGKKIVGEYD